MSNDLEHRACFDLPAPGSIIETHYDLDSKQDFINKIFYPYLIIEEVSDTDVELVKQIIKDRLKNKDDHMLDASDYLTKIPKGNCQRSFEKSNLKEDYKMLPSKPIMFQSPFHRFL